MLTLRISSGTAKNKKLRVPSNPDFRPTQEVAKQAIFAILADKTTGATCLDLFAGSGNLGLEALSRGAGWCDFVDEDTEATECIEANIVTCGFLDQAEVFRREAVKFADKTDRTYDVIFLDPYYKDTSQIYLLKQISKLLNPGGQAVMLYGDALDLETTLQNTELEIQTTRKFGATRFSFLIAKH